MGRWGGGEMGRWGDGEMGRWGDGEIFIKGNYSDMIVQIFGKHLRYAHATGTGVSGQPLTDS
ncbi:MAG: hypothetical protein F6K26_36970 [Moorea sp. SIO2I5]|nr:hypothetical protein [Moorena sp. SIO2I5]